MIHGNDIKIGARFWNFIRGIIYEWEIIESFPGEVGWCNARREIAGESFTSTFAIETIKATFHYTKQDAILGALEQNKTAIMKLKGQVATLEIERAGLEAELQRG